MILLMPENFRQSLDDQEYSILGCRMVESEDNIYMDYKVNDTSCTHRDDVWLSCDNVKGRARNQKIIDINFSKRPVKGKLNRLIHSQTV